MSKTYDLRLKMLMQLTGARGGRPMLLSDMNRLASVKGLDHTSVVWFPETGRRGHRVYLYITEPYGEDRADEVFRTAVAAGFQCGVLAAGIGLWNPPHTIACLIAHETDEYLRPWAGTLLDVCGKAMAGIP